MKNLATRLLVLALDHQDRIRQLVKMLPIDVELPPSVAAALDRVDEIAALMDEATKDAVVELGAHVKHADLKAALAKQREAMLERARLRLRGQ